ncbi:MAG: wax ester/triacylglycerol synthase family O-acyltransferase [Ardenticatenales bacterium]|nr:wax ester/triacylglycerol synthase family O-acyltransferase [Ardenticatenales bacterium]
MKPEPVSNIDAAILNVEDPTAPDNMGLLLLFDGKLNEEEVIERIKVAWLAHPRYRQRVQKRALGKMQWVEDPTFDIRAHFRRVAVPAPQDIEALRRTISELMGMLLDRSKPLWTMHLIEGGPSGDALLIRVHHAIGDGVTLLASALALFRDKYIPNQKKPRKFLIDRLLEPINDMIGTTQALTKWLKEQREQGLPSSADLLATVNQAIEIGIKLFPLIMDPPTILTGPLSRRKSVSWTPPIPSKDMRRISRTFEVSSNDLALAVVAGALRRYFISQNEKVPDVLHASVPVYLGESIELGNNFGIVLAPLPIGEPDPMKRVNKIHETMAHLKQSPEAQISAGIFDTAGRLPPSFVARAFDEVSRKASLVVTNVPGPPVSVSLAGAKLIQVVPFVPLSGRIGLGIAIAAYNRHYTLSIQADGERIKPSLRSFIQLLRAELALLTSLADGGTEAAEGTESTEDPQSVQCTAQTRQGTRCRNRARKGMRTCSVHSTLEETVAPPVEEPEKLPPSSRRQRRKEERAQAASQEIAEAAPEGMPQETPQETPLDAGSP